MHLRLRPEDMTFIFGRVLKENIVLVTFRFTTIQSPAH
ncbi:hypothetical protein EcE22_4719 [Escherichia coli E22]|nr:hypothetical protein EcE22_4719 [Escherichia coli E22]